MIKAKMTFYNSIRENSMIERIKKIIDNPEPITER